MNWEPAIKSILMVTIIIVAIGTPILIVVALWQGLWRAMPTWLQFVLVALVMVFCIGLGLYLLGQPLIGT